MHQTKKVASNEALPMFIDTDAANLSSETLKRGYNLEDEVFGPVYDYRRLYPGLGAVVIGIRGPKVRFLSTKDLVPLTDFKLRRPKRQWWIRTVREVTRLLAQQDP